MLLLLLYCLVANVRKLSLCHSPDLFDEEFEELCGGLWPALAVDMVLLTGAILVLVSWGGLFRYEDRPWAKDGQKTIMTVILKVS